MTTIDSRKVFATNVICEKDYIVLDLILNDSFTLKSTNVNFGDLISKVKVELSPELKCNTSSISASAINARLTQLEKQYDIVYKEFQKVQKELYDSYSLPHQDNTLREKYNQLEMQVGNIYGSICRAKNLLGNAISGNILIETPILGEFISSPYPKIVLYYKNIQKEARYSSSGLIPVFIHEMFHAWNYFEAGCQNRSIMEIDEAMVEFATIHYLNALAEGLAKIDKREATLISDQADWQKRQVREKQSSIGDLAAYGFGYYLAENISADAALWIEAYAGKSASLNSSDAKVGKITKALTPFYPFDTEAKVLKQLKDVLFDDGKVKTQATRTSHVSQVDILKSCLETMPQNDFTVDDVYKFEPIFKTLYPNNSHLRDKLRQLLQKLVALGEITRISEGCYKKN